MEIGIIGIALAFNFLIVKWKLEHNRIIDGIVDVSLLAVIMWLTGGTLTGMSIGAIASAIISLALLARPVKINGI